MQLTVQYKDGSARVVNLHPEFFENSEVRDRHKTIVVTPEQKALDMAHQNGANPYEILLMDGAEVVLRQVNKANKPEKKSEKPAHEWTGFMMGDGGVSTKEVKALKKEKFSKRWNPRTEHVPPTKHESSWERGVRLFLAHIK